jgi:cbb3-type cytochrome oxidase subunit 3
MYKEVLSGIQNVIIYPLFSFTVFFAFFLLITIWVLKSKNQDFDLVSRIPLSENDESK